MKPTFTEVLEYHVTGVTASPLRTGASDGDTQTILRDNDGVAFVQASSLAGALRAWLKEWSGSAARQLFGTGRQEGQLSVSDCVFDKKAAQESRPRVRIDPHTGAAAQGGKFDVTHLPTGTGFSFRLVWRGEAAEVKEAAYRVEKCLAALNSGAVTLGAHKGIGFGTVHLSEVLCRRYTLTDEKDRQDWLARTFNGVSVTLPTAEVRQVRFAVSIAADRLPVKSTTASGVGQEGIGAVPMKENRAYVVPGSSLRGVFRAQVGRIAPHCGVTPEQVTDLFGNGGKDCPQVKAGILRFSDGHFPKPQELPKVTRIRIDRFTGGVVRGGLFSEQPLEGTLRFTVDLPAGNPEACALLVFALRDMGLGLFTLGSGSSIGNGVARDLRAEITAPTGKAVLEVKNGTVTVAEGEALVNGWLAALQSHAKGGN